MWVQIRGGWNKLPAGSVCSTANGFGRGSSNLPDGESAMRTRQAWGWLTAGVLALGLNGFYHGAGADGTQRIVDRVVYGSAAVVALASGRADQFLQQAKM